MKILQVVDIGWEAGGAEKSVHLIQESLRQRGHDVMTLSTDKYAAGQKVFADAMVPAISGNAAMRLLRHLWYPAAYRKARQLKRNFRPDAVHLHTVSEFSPSLLYGFGRMPIILTLHGPEEFTRTLLPWLLPATDYRQNSYAWQDLRFVGRLRYSYYRWLQWSAYRLPLRRVSLIVAPSRFMARAAQLDFPGTPMKQLYNGIDLPDSSPLLDSTDPTVLYVGRLEAVKGVDYLIRAFARLRADMPTARLRVVGDGSQRQSLEALAERLGLKTEVTFTGWAGQKRIVQEYIDAQVVAIPSVWPENLPTVGLEALAVGRPLIGSRTGGLDELIKPGRNGLLVKPQDERALAWAMRELLLDRPQLQQAAEASRRLAGRFDKTVFIDKLLKLYEDTIHEYRHR